MEINLNPSWKERLLPEFEKPYFGEIRLFLKAEKAAGKTIYPSGQQIFSAFDNTPFENVKVVIIGQDPYHGHGQANGLCFSVSPGIKPPPSLVNIFKEIETDLGIPLQKETGDLSAWARQGVLLLNAVLTVRANEPASHGSIGWQQFTDSIISKVSAEKDAVVFLLWGKFAQSKKALIDPAKHLVLEASHPSPFSASAGFFGCRHFSKSNQWLASKGIGSISWGLE
ncbi:MAG: uracil-DNA glycosylase [Flavobacteriaceae bacterium]|nr:uracil-DNA glycosylase [Flavobacteriaceae bacterium]